MGVPGYTMSLFFPKEVLETERAKFYPLSAKTKLCKMSQGLADIKPRGSRFIRATQRKDIVGNITSSQNSKELKIPVGSCQQLGRRWYFVTAGPWLPQPLVCCHNGGSDGVERHKVQGKRSAIATHPDTDKFTVPEENSNIKRTMPGTVDSWPWLYHWLSRRSSLANYCSLGGRHSTALPIRAGWHNSSGLLRRSSSQVPKTER